MRYLTAPKAILVAAIVIIVIPHEKISFFLIDQVFNVQNLILGVLATVCFCLYREYKTTPESKERKKPGRKSKAELMVRNGQMEMFN